MAEGEIVTIHRVAAAAAPAQAVEKIEILADFGLRNDYRSGAGSRRQVTLVSEEALLAVGKELGRPVAPGASRRQIMVRGLDLNALIGRKLRIGKAELEVTDLCHGCARMEETIGPGAQAALKDRAGLCCRAVAGGIVGIGDRITTD